MSGASRQAKNPLLSAAGEGFPYENYVENALLVPVTPSTPAVLRDDAEPESVVGKESANSHNSPATSTHADSEFTPIPLNTEETNVPENQPAKQGYFTSIFSSLPNLSLSSITGESSQANQGSESTTTAQDGNLPLPPFDHRNSLTDTVSPPVPSFYETRPTSFARSSEVYPKNSSTLPPPPQSIAAPPTIPTIPSTGDGPISYRLGNQRRLKYAPPPELTSTTTKPYSAPAVQPVITSQNVAPLSIFNPNESAVSAPAYQPVEAVASTNSPSVERSTPEQLSQANSLQESFRSSPVASAVSYSSTGTPRSVTPQSPNSGYESVPSRTTVPQSSSRPIPQRVQETATPQNTPVTFSFPVFDSYPIQPDFLTSAITEKNAIRNLPGQVDLQVSKEIVTASRTEAKPTVTFAPTSAIQISEKLEHLLAERKEESSKLVSEAFANPEASTPGSRSADASDSVSSDITEKNSLLKPEPVPIPPQETPATSPPEEQLVEPLVKLDAALSNVPPSQHFQPFPLTSSFLPEQPVQQKSSFNYTPETSSSSAFADPQLAQPASSFFETKSIGQFPPPQFQESSVNVDLLANTVRNDSQQPPANPSLNWYFDNPQAPQTFWDTAPVSNAEIVGTTGSIQPPPPPPLYNPLQFQSDFHRPPTLRRQPYVSPFVLPSQQPVNQIQHYFENLSGPPQTRDAATGNHSIFPPMPPGITSVPEPTGTATLSPAQMSINPLSYRTTPDGISPDSQNLPVDPSDNRMQYRTVYHHWFYRKEVEHKVLWFPFTMQDSLRLEEVHNSTEITPETTIATDGGRYDVDILRRQRSPVYWSGASTEVRRCSWFFKGNNESAYTPYDESTAAKLEEEYKLACVTNRWNRTIDLNNGEYIIFYCATRLLHYTSMYPETLGSWSNSTVAVSRPRTVKRGLHEFNIEDGEPERVDHLLFLVHGIGSVCDLKFRTVEEVVDEFRSRALQLVQSHYRTASEQRIVNRIELLPVSWHTTLHSEDTGIDKKLQAITLPSIPKLRYFTNDTLLDILFYTSPVYCQTIMQTVVGEINRLYTLFKSRNPDFDGGIYLGGHSLGSLILFDLLCHQKPLTEDKSSDENETAEEKNEEDNDSVQPLSKRVVRRRRSKKISYVMGAAGTGQPYIHYPQLNFHPRAFFALGSPIGMFVTVRGIDMLGEDFVLPTCPAFFNIFHPFDPVAYRVEALINLEASKYRPMLIPHHKGRKRMHLEVREVMADLKEKFLHSVRNTLNSVYSLSWFRADNSTFEEEIDKVVEEQLQEAPSVSDQQSTDDAGEDFKVGKLNGGRRIDYVLQEAPLESINEYIFAVRSHVCYWESEDTMLMILKEIYGSEGIQTDAQLPQHPMSIERTTPSPSSTPSLKKLGTSQNDWCGNSSTKQIQ